MTNTVYFYATRTTCKKNTKKLAVRMNTQKYFACNKTFQAQ